MKSLVKNTVMVGGLTLVSRIFGMIRDVVIAFVLGAGAASDAFYLAFRLPDLFRKLLGEGILGLSVVPVISRTLAAKGRRQTAELAMSLLTLTTVLVIILGPALFWLAPAGFGLLFEDQAAASYSREMTLLLFKLMIPYICIVGVLSAGMGILNGLGHFGAPAAAPLVFNLVVILFTVLIAFGMENPVIVLAAGVTAGGLLQLLMLIPFLGRFGMVRLRRFPFFHPGVKACLKNLLPGMIGSGGYQINLLTGFFLAFFLEQGNVTFLYYADRLVQFALGIFMVSVATVLLPQLSLKSAAKDSTLAMDSFIDGIKLVFFLVIPAMAGLVALRYPIVELLFHHGAFDMEAVEQTAECLLYLGSGMWAYAGVRLAVTWYHGMLRFRWPVYAGLVSMAVYGLSAVFIFRPLTLFGIAMAQVLAAVVQLCFLLAGMRGSLRRIFDQTFLFMVKTTGISLVMYSVVIYAAALIFEKNCDKVFLAAGVAGCILAGAFVYLVLQRVLSGREFKMIKQRMMPKKR